MTDRQATTRGDSLQSTVAKGGSWIVVVVGRGELRTHPVGAGAELVIGRDLASDVPLDHHRVSRRHVRLRLDRDAIIVEDLGSRNGTLVGTPLASGEARAIRPGDAIVIGPFTVVVVRDADAPSTSSSHEVHDPRGTTPSPTLVAIARSATSVLIRGESGTGKQVLAETIHRLSGRGGRLVSINCAAIGHDLLESELFGHEKGAFTGAIATKPGLLEVAGEGTVLLDEIGDMPPALQAKLLRAVESREVMRVGGTTTIAIRARFVSATHRDLLGGVEAGTFRLDLYYRLAGVTLAIPPLRERRGRIVALADELLDGRAALSPAAVARLQAHDWPGNVRELRNVVERAVIFADGKTIDAEHVVFDDAPSRASDTAASPETRSTGERGALDAGEQAERERIVGALAACNGNQTRAAKMLGMARSTLVTKLSILRIPRPRK